MSLSPSATADDVIAWLKPLRNDANIVGMGRFGIRTDNALGIPNAVLRPLARQIGKNHQRAIELWQSGIREARLLATFTDEPKKVGLDQARSWAAEFESWEIVDHSADLFVEAGLHGILIAEFAADDREFVRRAAFAMMAWGAVHLKKEPDATLLGWLPLIEKHAADPRNFVKKAVNWALRQIGKRNSTCHAPALSLAERLAESSDRTTRWIGRDAVRELTSDRVLKKIGQR